MPINPLPFVDWLNNCKKAVINENGRVVKPLAPNSPSKPAIPCVTNVHPGIILPASNKMMDNTMTTPTLQLLDRSLISATLLNAVSLSPTCNQDFSTDILLVLMLGLSSSSTKLRLDVGSNDIGSILISCKLFFYSP